MQQQANKAKSHFTEMSSIALKATLRSRMITLRKQYSGKSIDIQASTTPKMVSSILELIEHYASADNFRVRDNIKCIGGYYPVKGELNVLPIMKHFHSLSWTIALPVIGLKRNPLTFATWNKMDQKELTSGKYGIPISQSKVIVQPDVLLVPLVGFTSRCARLGYGGGYYDQTIRQLRAEKKLRVAIGIAYEMQRCDEIPIENTDETLDAVVTELKVYKGETGRKNTTIINNAKQNSNYMK